MTNVIMEESKNDICHYKAKKEIFILKIRKSKKDKKDKIEIGRGEKRW